ncbi:MAG: hypothetical protein IPL43_11725 [Micropruina sp.]|nr:hypothetical protein [Micropruina sp.]
MRYLDTGGRDPEHSLYRWLETNLPEATSFACQTGYFSGDGIFPLEAVFMEVLDRGGDFHLVVGGNEGGVRSDDLTYVLDLFDRAATAGNRSLTLGPPTMS